MEIEISCLGVEIKQGSLTIWVGSGHHESVDIQEHKLFTDLNPRFNYLQWISNYSIKSDNSREWF